MEIEDLFELDRHSFVSSASLYDSSADPFWSFWRSVLDHEALTQGNMVLFVRPRYEWNIEPRPKQIRVQSSLLGAVHRARRKAPASFRRGSNERQLS